MKRSLAWRAPSGFPLDGAVLCFVEWLVSVHMHYRAELRRQLMRFDELASYGLFAAQVDAADLYFKQSAACLCGYRNSSPHKSVR
jgi:hypothetical protein